MKKQHYAIKHVKQQAEGKWHDVLSHLCPDLADALAKPGKHVACAIHGGKKDFRLFRDYTQTGGGVCTCGTYKDGFDLLCALNNCTLDQAVSDVANILGMGDSIPTVTLRTLPKPKIDPEEQAKKDKRICYWLNRIWNHASGNEHFRSRIALRYLHKRGLTLKALPNALRLNPSVQYFDDATGKMAGSLPTMVAQVKDPAGRPVTLHRTYLTYTGEKADVEDPKKLMGFPSDRSLHGAAIRLFEAGRVLGLTEGIETALAVHEATAMPVWACISNTLLERVVVPDSVGLVVIWADNDRSGAGQTSARKLSVRLQSEGFQTIIMIPQWEMGYQKGIDWLDMLNRYGREAFFQDTLEVNTLLMVDNPPVAFEFKEARMGMVNLKDLDTNPGKNNPFSPPEGWTGSREDYIELMRRRHKTPESFQRIHAAARLKIVNDDLTFTGPFGDVAEKMLNAECKLIRKGSLFAA